MYDKVKGYKEKLEAELFECFGNPVSDRYAAHTDSMLNYWLTVCKVEEKMAHGGVKLITPDDAKEWSAKMVNEDGTMGGHWTIEQTSSVANSYGVKFEHITDYDWNVTMNMMYSDYCHVAKRFGVDTPEFYACMAKAFLFDKDGPGPKEKLSAYYHCVVNK